MITRKFDKNDTYMLISLWQTVFPEDPPHNEPSLVINDKLAVDGLVFVTVIESKIVGACMAGYDGHRG